jgi:hypothetical protein
MMDYNSIGGFLEKFKKLIFQKEETKSIIIRIISEEISHNIESGQIKIKDGFIFIQGSPILRGEIIMHKNQILTKLKNLIPGQNFLDIK